MFNKVVFGTLVLTALSISSAMASPAGHHDHAHVQVNHGPNFKLTNQFDGDVDLFVNGRFVGKVKGNKAASFHLASGWTDVVVKRSGTNVVLTTGRLPLWQGQLDGLTVIPPKTNLQLVNRGKELLFVDAKGAPGVWLRPGQTASVRVVAGDVEVTAKVNHGSRLSIIESRTVFAEPGVVTTKNINLGPPTPVFGTMAVTNPHSHRISVVIDGRHLGWLNPRQTMTYQVKVGSPNVTIRSHRGVVLSNERVTIHGGRRTNVAVRTHKKTVRTVTVAMR